MHNVCNIACYIDYAYFMHIIFPGIKLVAMDISSLSFTERSAEQFEVPEVDWPCE